MNALLVTFIGTSALLWFSIYGYLFFLWLMASRKPRLTPKLTEYPPIALVIPTLNEENLILSKLKNLETSTYPSRLFTVLVVDGGSADRTVEYVQREIDAGKNIRLVCVDKPGGKSGQIRTAFRLIQEEIAVVTDTDSALEPSCISEVVSRLVSEPGTAVVGASVRPGTGLLEEQLHWRFLNYLWWLEGEALSAASISGVCYACRPAKVMPDDGPAKAEDIHLALTAAARGHAVRIGRRAFAFETRVPQSLAELLKFRRRRGGVYVSELLRARQMAAVPLGYLLARLMRLWHFLVTPKIAIVILLAGVALFVSGFRLWPLASLAAFIFPALAILSSSDVAPGLKLRWLKLGGAACRLLVLTLISMLVLNTRPAKQGPVGGRP